MQTERIPGRSDWDPKVCGLHKKPAIQDTDLYRKLLRWWRVCPPWHDRMGLQRHLENKVAPFPWWSVWWKYQSFAECRRECMQNRNLPYLCRNPTRHWQGFCHFRVSVWCKRRSSHCNGWDSTHLGTSSGSLLIALCNRVFCFRASYLGFPHMR